MYRGEGGFYGLLMQGRGNREPQSLCSRGRQETESREPQSFHSRGRQETGNREQGTGKREPQSLRSRGRQETGNREQETGIRKLGTGKYTEGQDSSLRSE